MLEASVLGGELNGALETKENALDGANVVEAIVLGDM